MIDVLDLVKQRFETLDATNLPDNEWTDDDCREADFLLRVQITIMGQNYSNQRLTFALTRLRDGVKSGDPEEIRKGMLWAEHHLPRYGTLSANSNQ